jgi:hypothetical protein
MIDRSINCIHALCHAIDQPRLAEMLTKTIDCSKLQKTTPEEKLITVGALLAAGKLDRLEQVLQLLDFNELTLKERSHLIARILTVFDDILKPPGNNSELARSILQLATTICPEELHAHEQGRSAPAPKKLLELHYAPRISHSIKGTVFFRETMFGTGSRKHEFGHRIQTALASQGWNIGLSPAESMHGFSSSCICDVAFVDVGYLGLLPLDNILEILSGLRSSFRIIIIIEPDPWTGNADDLLSAISDHIDYVWGFTADWDLVDGPCFRERAILFPNVGGFDHIDNNVLAEISWNTCSFNFSGSVQDHNINRVYWLLESVIRGLPITINITDPTMEDGLDRESSLLKYAQLLASNNASINFTTRSDGSRILTGRSVEIISLNRLLVQESCPPCHNYYVEGEHFLEFVDMDGLGTIIDFLKSHPKTAQKICDLGYQFYKERYSSRKMVEHIQTWL